MVLVLSFQPQPRTAAIEDGRIIRETESQDSAPPYIDWWEKEDHHLARRPKSRIRSFLPHFSWLLFPLADWLIFMFATAISSWNSSWRRSGPGTPVAARILMYTRPSQGKSWKITQSGNLEIYTLCLLSFSKSCAQNRRREKAGEKNVGGRKRIWEKQKRWDQLQFITVHQ